MAHPPALKVSAGERREKNRPFLHVKSVFVYFTCLFRSPASAESTNIDCQRRSQRIKVGKPKSTNAKPKSTNPKSKAKAHEKEKKHRLIRT